MSSDRLCSENNTKLAFLFQAGAEPDYRPIAVSGNSPRNKAHQSLLMGGLSNKDEEALRCLTRGDDFIGEQNLILYCTGSS